MWHTDDSKSFYVFDDDVFVANASTQANAKHIVRCVNSHDALAAALREIVTDPALIDNVHRFDEWMDKARAALAALDKTEA